MNEESETDSESSIPLEAAAELQDHLMTASNDLDRLQRLLSDACVELFAGFHSACEHIQQMHAANGGESAASAVAIAQLGKAITALQFQDMASQLITHTNTRLRSCADTLARETFGYDEEGATIITPLPLNPNPVTQDEMDAGSVDLF